MSLTVGSRIAHYDVTALIGEGGMGRVYQATDTKLNQSGKVMRWCVSAIGSARRSVSRALRVIALVMTTQLAWGGTVGSQVPSLSSPATESTVSDSWEAVLAIPLGTRLLAKLVDDYIIEGDLVDVQQNVISVATDSTGTVRLDRARVTEILRGNRAHGFRGGGRLTGRAVGGLWRRYREEDWGNQDGKAAGAILYASPLLLWPLVPS